jgi:xanthine dehydrogenase accessory factor
VTVSFYRQMAAALQQGAIAVATVVQSRGSVPREVGAKLFLDAQGDCVGTIGGGAGEAKVIHQAKKVCETGASQWVELNLSGSPQRHAEGICGGVMQVWVDRWQGQSALALVQSILTQLEAGQAVTLVTPLEPGRSPFLAKPSHSDPTPHAFTEILLPPPTLLIIGAGHCGIQLAKVADLIGFQVIVQDDRPEWANAKYYPQASKILTGAIADAVSQLALHTQLYAALVTRGYAYDLEALRLLLQRSIPCQYIGMIGSQKRVRQVLQTLEKAGISAAQLSNVNAPIGLDIGALTPEEIAVSIAAELILVRRGGTGQPLSQRQQM